MKTYNVSVVARNFYDYTIEANSMAEAISMAEDATKDMDIFESLTLVKEGRIILDDAGSLSPEGTFAGIAAKVLPSV